MTTIMILQKKTALRLLSVSPFSTATSFMFMRDEMLSRLLLVNIGFGAGLAYWPYFLIFYRVLIPVVTQTVRLTLPFAVQPAGAVSTS